ncbi:MAG TPA: hypothetical protein PKE06_02560 [Flavilitoribacter sp.]|nr:hypothetical protein [Flavilitoribacter sp.]HMQ86383.1 hypothetical protein [Flavilitoribacter sp.]
MIAPIIGFRYAIDNPHNPKIMTTLMYLFMGAMTVAGFTSLNAARFRRIFATSIFMMLIMAVLIWLHYAAR